MRKVGTTELPLHYEKVPFWLLVKMRKLTRPVDKKAVDRSIKFRVRLSIKPN